MHDTKVTTKKVDHGKQELLDKRNKQRMEYYLPQVKIVLYI